jgi:hypothetical protein
MENEKRDMHDKTVINSAKQDVQNDALYNTPFV